MTEAATPDTFEGSKILILDFGSQYTQVIARRIRECQVYSQIVPFDTPAGEIAAMGARGIILSGGPASVYGKNAPQPDPGLFKLGLPVLGICYGMQLMGFHLGGKVENSARREYGASLLQVSAEARKGGEQGDLFHGLPDVLDIWNSHGDKLTKLPKGFAAAASTENSPYAAIADRKRHFYGLQFHPEVVHTPRGKEMLQNFVYHICGSQDGLDHGLVHRADLRAGAAEGGRCACGAGAERRGRFQRGRGAAAQGDRRPIDLHLREQRPAALEGSGSGAPGLRREFPCEAEVCGRLARSSSAS